MQEQELLALVRDARRLCAANAGRSWLVAPSAPVLFFGDLPGFGESIPRVATVALNPSRREFPAADPFRRFPGAESPDDASYLRSLFGYFRTAPYVSWFDFYEQALLGIGTSYYGNGDAVALHTDIGSVLATDPTWSGLDAPIREQLAQAGVPLWHRLVEHLKPNILLWSTAHAWLELIKFRALTEWERIESFCLTEGGERRKRPIRLEARWYELSTGAPFFVAYVPALQKPLAGLSHAQKRQAGRIVREHWSYGV